MFKKVKSYACYRGGEILLLLGIPLLGVVLARPSLTLELVGRLIVFCLATSLWLFHAYTFNDWSNFSLDLNDPNKQTAPLLNRMITLNEVFSFSALTLLAGVFLYLIFLPLISLLICMSMVTLCILYSNRFTLLKNIPGISTFIHLISGPLLFNLGWSLVAPLSGESILAGLFFGLLYSAGHLSHESIDYEGDQAAGLRTTPILFGLRPVFLASAIGVTLATAWLVGITWLGFIYPWAVAIVFVLAWIGYCFGFIRVWKTSLSHQVLAGFRTRYRRIYALAGICSLLAALIFPVSRRVYSPRITLLGVDALDWQLVKELGKKGHLPTLSRLRRMGVSGPLRSIKPTISPALWTTMVTGKGRNKHGITDFTMVDESGKTVPATVSHRRVKAIWNILSERGLKVGFVNWWPSYPAEQVNGFIVSNYLRYLYPNLAADGQMELKELEGLPGLSWPPELGQELLSGYNSAGGFFAEIDLAAVKGVGFAGGYDPVFQKKFQDGYEVFLYGVLGDEGALDVSSDLLKKYELDLFGVYLEGVDILCHLFWGYRDPDRFKTDPQAARILGTLIEDYYVYLDRKLGEFIADFSSDDYLILVSDHGYGLVGKDKHFHIQDGVIIMTGPGLIPGGKLEGASVLDITPTVLYLMGLPVADDMEGKPLVSALAKAFCKKHPLLRVKSYEGEQSFRPVPSSGTAIDAGYMKRLRALGYID